MSSLVGRTGTVVTRIAGAAQPGEVEVLVGGMRERLLAFSADAIALGEPVLVIAVRGALTVDVVPWMMTPGQAGAGTGSS